MRYCIRSLRGRGKSFRRSECFWLRVVPTRRVDGEPSTTLSPSTMMPTLVRKLQNALILASVCAGLQACGCDGVACVDGLLVNLATPVPASYKVELLVAGIVQPAPASATCASGNSCGGSVLFDTNARNQVSVRVTTSTGAKTTEYSTLTYKSTASDCSNCRGQAEVVAQVP